jgi:beta-lactamase class A
VQANVEQELSILGGRSACVVMRLDASAPRELVSIHPDVRFPAASLAKVPLLVELARQVEMGMLDWGTQYSLPEAARVASDGVLADLSPTLRPNLHDLAHLMITISDNTASNLLLDLVGMEAVNTTMQQLGLNSTRLERRFIDFAARREGRDNWTTAGDMALLFSYFCTELLPGRAKMLNMLLRQNDYTILPAYWGEGVPFAHKTGGLKGIVHDAGILYPPTDLDGQREARVPFIIVVMTSEQTNEPLTRYVLARIGKIIYNAAS